MFENENEAYFMFSTINYNFSYKIDMDKCYRCRANALNAISMGHLYVVLSQDTYTKMKNTLHSTILKYSCFACGSSNWLIEHFMFDLNTIDFFLTKILVQQ